MKHSYPILTIGALLAGAVAFSGPAEAAKGAAYFKGKTVTWIVASGTGGGHDYYARLFSRHMEKALPGSTFVVKNRPGAGHRIGANLIYAAKPNGLTIGSFTTGLIYAQIMKLKGIRFDLSKMSWLGKGASDIRVISVAKTSEYKTWNDLLNTKRKIKFSASGVGSGGYNDAFLIGEAWGFPYRIIVGYQGTESALGMLRGETDALVGGLSSGMNYVRAGHTRVILRFGPSEQFAELMKNVPDALTQAKTSQQKTLGKMLTLYGQLSRISTGPPNMIPDRLAALRAAYVTAATSKAAMAEAKKSFRVIEHADGKKTAKMVQAMLKQPPQIIDMLLALNKARDNVPMVKHTGPVSKIKRGGRRVWIMYKGKEMKTKISGSRTKVTINGKKAKRKKIKVGMTCTFTYPKPGGESKSVDCKK